MSYARWGWDNSDVYVFMNVGGWLECCACFMGDGDSFKAYSTDDMLEHLLRHVEVGHTVPVDTMISIYNDNERNFPTNE